MIEIIGGVWAAGETKTFHINGEYLEILEAQYPCDVMLMDRQGAQLSIMRSSEASFFSRPKEGFNSVQITSAQAQAIRIFVGSGDAGTRRISSTVQVVDGGLRRSLANAAFLANGNVAGAPVASVQLWNPAGSGRNLILKSLLVGASGATGVQFAGGTVAGGTLQYSGYPKLLGGVIGVGQVRTQATAITVNNFQDSVYLQSVVSLLRPLNEPIIIPPAYGYTALSGAAVTMNCTFEWTEEAI